MSSLHPSLASDGTPGGAEWGGTHSGTGRGGPAQGGVTHTEWIVTPAERLQAGSAAAREAAAKGPAFGPLAAIRRAVTAVQWRNRLLPWLVPALLLLAWHVASVSGWLSRQVLPAPLDTLRAFWTLAASGELWTHVKVSTARALAGLAVGGGIGLVLGLINGTWRPAETLLDSTIQMVRNIPALALIPLVILWFGIEESAKLFLIAITVFFPIYLNTFHGIRSVDPTLLEMARAYGLSGWRLYREVVLPAALPSILVGLRFSLGLMWVVLIVAETISAQAGIGFMTMNAREFLQTDVVVVGILLYALLGKLADVIARGLERGLLRWNPAYQDAA